MAAEGSSQGAVTQFPAWHEPVALGVSEPLFVRGHGSVSISAGDSSSEQTSPA